jgi:tRNA-specific 2-thiouridylase
MMHIMNNGFKTKETVYVGLSGGVDSSVAAKRLIDAGHNVVGVFIKTWQPDFIACNWEAERLDAMRVAAHLGIPFYTCDAVDAYRDGVAEYMIREYEKGRTPNPDVMCNRYVKFGTFLEYARAQGVDIVATGHYARNEYHDGSYHLLRGIDTNKDQSYFLWTLTQEQLSHIRFPVGDTPKAGIREEAHIAGLRTATKNDSQGICFLGEIDIKEFLSHYITTTSGDVLNVSGERIGTHEGALYYTLGQRHGFAIENKNTESTPHYVIARDIERNTITVAEKRLTLTTHNTIHLSDCNFIQETGDTCEAQFRYRQKPFDVRITKTSDTTATLDVVDTSIETPSPGQSCVLYRGDECLGGGIIDSVI